VNQLLMTGESTTVDYGTAERSVLLVRIDRHHDGVSFTVTEPMNTTLDRTFRNEDLVGATAYMQFLHDAANAGLPVREIEQQAGVLTSAAAAVEDAERSIAADRPAPFVPTRTNVHLKPLTAAELDLIRQHRGGEVTTRPGQPWLMLRAIVRRGFGEPVYRRGRRIVAVQLNQRGLAAADEQAGAAA
jgi:hypothetical protein